MPNAAPSSGQPVHHRQVFEMIHLLPSHPSGIDDRPGTVRTAWCTGQLGSQEKNFPQDQLMNTSPMSQGINMRFGDPQEI